MPQIVAVVAAGRGRGKTSLVETLCRALSKGFTVWTVKHLSHTPDLEDKDTWRHVGAGAQGTIAVSPSELVVFKPRPNASIEDALQEVPEGVDLVLVEGYRSSPYPKVLVAESMEEAEEELKRIGEVFAVHIPTGCADRLGGSTEVPVLSEADLVKKVREMVVTNQVGQLPGLNCGKCGYAGCSALGEAIREGSASVKQCVALRESDLSLLVDGHRVHLSPFPESLVRNVLLAMVGTLKGGNSANSVKVSVRRRGSPRPDA